MMDRHIIKLLLASSALIFMLFVKPNNLTVFDYQLWFIFICAATASILDFIEYYRIFGYASTLTLTVIALIFLFAGRFGMSLLTSLATCYPGLLIGFIILAPTNLYLYAYFCGILMAGMFLTLGTIIIHLIFGRPVSFAESMSYARILHWFKNALTESYLSTPIMASVTAFILGLSFRLFPEIYWWPWLIGWDTVEYVAHLRDFMTSLNPFKPYYWMGGLRNIPPLMNILLAPFAAIVDGWILMKFYPPICYGFLTAATTYLSAKVLGLRGRYLLASIIASIFFILNLRISWDYQRQLLGSIFMVLSVALLELYGYLDEAVKQIIPTSMLILSAMSHEVTAYVSAMLSLSAVTYILVKEKRLWKMFPYMVSAILSIILLAWYARGFVWRNPFMGVVPAGVVSYKISSVEESLAYLVAGYGLLIPLVLIGIRSCGIYYRLAVIFLLAAGLSPLIAPKTAIATWYRFLIGASPLMIPLAFRGIASTNIGKYLILYLIILIFPGLCFYMPYGAYGGRLIAALREFPPYLAPSPSSHRELEDLRELSWFVEKLKPEAPIIVDASTARWVHLGLRNPRPSQLTWLWSNPVLEEVLDYIKRENQSRIYWVTRKSEAWLKIKLEDNQDVDLFKGYQLKVLRNGIYKVYEIRVKS